MAKGLWIHWPLNRILRLLIHLLLAGIHRLLSITLLLLLLTITLRLLTIALRVRAVRGIDGRREPWWPIEATAIPSEGAEGWRKGGRRITPGSCARSRSVVVALRS